MDAIGGGRRAARSIHQFVMGQPVTADGRRTAARRCITETIFDRVPGVVPRPRAEMVELPAAERIRSFVEVDQVLTEEAARRRERPLPVLLPDLLQPGHGRTGRGARLRTAAGTRRSQAA
ncbi:MAG: hypothetical protein MZV70_20300 [Desulfobacterales bacterium]|nr:hypothetical protein [Desulfobacterales bacterium]